MLGSILAGGKNAGIDPGGRENYRNRSWRVGRTWFRISRDMVSSISISEKGEEGFKVCSEEPGGREEYWDRSWRAGKMLGSILMDGKNAGIDPDGGREERGLGISLARTLYQNRYPNHGSATPPVQVRIFLYPHWYLVLDCLSPTPVMPYFSILDHILYQIIPWYSILYHTIPY